MGGGWYICALMLEIAPAFLVCGTEIMSMIGSLSGRTDALSDPQDRHL